jgi:hypothetical protein
LGGLGDEQHTCSIHFHIQCMAIQGPHGQQHAAAAANLFTM